MSWIRRILKLFVLAMLTTYMITACGNQIVQHPVSKQFSPTSECQVIRHEMGETKICDRPQKIVVFGPYILELLLALDVQPAGFADQLPFHHGDYNNPSQQIPYLGERITGQPINVGLAYSPSIEALLKIKPDLILGTEANTTQYEMLSKIAPTLLLKWFDAKSNLRLIAQVLGRSAQAEQILANNDQRLAIAQKAFSPIVAAHPQVLILVSAGQSLQQQLRFPNTKSFCTSLVANLGFQVLLPQNLSQSHESLPPPLSIETLSQFNDADLIILLGANFSDFHQISGQNYFDPQVKKLKQQWSENAIAQTMPASQENRVYFIPGYLCLGLPGPIGTELYVNELQKQLLSP
ncbi:iron-siderophore ABC transporter substrate-binding protein [Anabaena cylindrica]|uniref:iron-siderophore ABC transporter substrate-binding protein n=1 Tax=Anabaena cylindrica TaxID=1165 RepID=UPI002B21DE66|nr:iron-siderophore ABC transporter substrate-binding protein [Anabaena cylindrica]